MASEVESTQDAMARVVRDTVRPLSLGFGLFILYQAYTGFSEHTGRERLLIVGADALVGTYLLVLAFLVWTREFPLRVMNGLGASLAVALGGTDMTTMAVTGSVPSFPSTALVLAGLGAVVLSWRWMLIAEGIVWLSWIGLTQMFAENPMQSFFVMQVSAITGLAIHWGRLQAYRQLIGARDRAARAKEELLQINQELDRFAAVAAHDLKNPISAIRLKAAALRTKTNDDAAREALEDLDRVARDMGRMVDDLLGYARLATIQDQGEQAPLSVVAQEVEDLFEDALFSAGATLVVEDLPDLICSRTMMRQLLQNLISNSLLYRSKAPPRVVLSGSLEGGMVVLRVADNGMGFDPSLADTMFEPFERGQVDAPGHGLGLATCRRIVERLGGTIEASSHLGEGAVFTIRLPKGEEGEKVARED